MGQLQLRAEVHGERLLQARELFFEQGDHPDGLVDPLILRSWERCRRFGVGDPHLTDVTSTMDRVALKTEQERNRFLLTQSRPIMEHVFEQIRESGSMVILADANGLLLETVGDPDFVSRADRVSPMALVPRRFSSQEAPNTSCSTTVSSPAVPARSTGPTGGWWACSTSRAATAACSATPWGW